MIDAIISLGIVFIIMVIYIAVAIKKKINLLQLSCILVFLLIVMFILLSRFRKLTPKQLAFVHTKLKSMLTRFTSVMHKHRYNYFMIGGTLLGCIREGDIISHDDDIDLAMMKDELDIMLSDHNLIKDLENNNLKISKPRPLIGMCFKIRNIKNESIFDKSRIFIDLFSYSKFKSSIDNNHIIHYTNRRPRKKWVNSFFYEHELYPLQIMYLDNIPVFSAYHPIPYLERHYGKDWMIPRWTHTHSVYLNLNKNCYGECFLF
tara:strand:- start:507 stop:1289 length:783 start_codon:yes stop_codon:yes gene_type:complete